MKIHKQIIIQKNSFQVLEAFTNSMHTKQWWAGCETFFDPAVSQTISWQWRNDQGAFTYITHSRVKRYSEGLFLELENGWQYDFQKPQPIGPIHLLLECTPQVNHTLLVIKQAGFQNNSQDWIDYYNAANSGWDEVLPKLKEYLEAGIING